jgi:nicotinamide mononucleotide transporter
MQSVLQLFSIHNILFSVQGYEVSYIELLGALLSLWAYIEIIRRKSRGLIISMLGSLTLGFLFHQIQLYSDMMLMIYYIIASAIALVFWQRNKQRNHADLIKVTRLNPKTRLILLALMFTAIAAFSLTSGSLHQWLPQLFPAQAHFILYDATTTTLGITASILLIRRNMESMALWFVADIISLSLYFLSGVTFLAITYTIYAIVDFTGYILWAHQSRKTNSHQ